MESDDIRVTASSALFIEAPAGVKLQVPSVFLNTGAMGCNSSNVVMATAPAAEVVPNVADCPAININVPVIPENTGVISSSKEADMASQESSQDSTPVMSVPQFPATESQQRLQTGKSSSESIERRGKVALLPRHSLMDWVRLGNSGVDLAGVGGNRLSVTPEQLARHNAPDDCWMCLKGTVYNVTPYMQYHPGGSDELMRGAGQDALDLFNEVHRWVNIESMLSKCLVGRMVGSPARSKPNFRLYKPRNEYSVSASEESLLSIEKRLPLRNAPTATSPAKPHYEWWQRDDVLVVVVYTRCEGFERDLVVVDRRGRDLRALFRVRDRTYEIHLELEGALSEDDDEHAIRVDARGRVEITLTKAPPGAVWPDVGQPLCGHTSWDKTAAREPHYWDCEVLSSRRVSHDTLLIGVGLPAGCRMRVPVGRHVFVTATVDGVEVSRPYTAVLPSLDPAAQDPRVAAGRALYLVVKVYDDGALTPMFGRLVAGDALRVSSFDGRFSASRLDGCTHLVMFAAGTGITPMIRLIYRALEESDGDDDAAPAVTLVFFNKTEADIVWRKDFDALACRKPGRFGVHHVLSQAGDGWTGERGRVDAAIVRRVLPAVLSDSSKLLVCVCGPTPFTNAAVDILQQQGLGDQLHAFQS
ncbi:PREDICTED: cytochrome b5 reductase 4-like [Priapulus caudatus]|uniref:Cytochrome b5 reductase 4 n=1 Tax=Priapulus caudatus TaxID=37621 RepID=A0ABM1EAC3_PRICU|nr:PREDICTED: cytochrome b5 reductase 4-like [Priapulus caudatus]